MPSMRTIVEMMLEFRIDDVLWNEARTARSNPDLIETFDKLFSRQSSFLEIIDRTIDYHIKKKGSRQFTEDERNVMRVILAISICGRTMDDLVKGGYVTVSEKT